MGTWGKAGSKPIQVKEAPQAAGPIALKATKIVDKEPIQKAKVEAPALKPTQPKTPEQKDSRPGTPKGPVVALKCTPRGGGTPKEGTPVREMVALKPVLKGHTQTQTK